MTKNEFYTKWLQVFASTVSKRDLECYVQATGNYIWHVFSWELLDASAYLTGDEAKKAYDRASKRDAIYFEWFEEDQTNALPWEQYAAKALDECTEIYVVGKDFEWTYIKTHDSMCGPYFMKRP